MGRVDTPGHTKMHYFEMRLDFFSDLQTWADLVVMLLVDLLLVKMSLWRLTPG